MTGNKHLYPVKYNDVCNYNPRCITYSGEFIDDIIIFYKKSIREQGISAMDVIHSIMIYDKGFFIMEIRNIKLAEYYLMINY